MALRNNISNDYAAKQAHSDAVPGYNETVPAQSSIENSLDELRDRRHQLTVLIDILHDRLDPLLYPDKDARKDSGPPVNPRPIAGQIVLRITCEADMLQFLCVQLDALLGRLEV